jgi:hypothetical protein
MLVIEVSLNGRRLCAAGIPDGIYSASVDVTDLSMPNGELLPASLRVDGLKDFTNLEWHSSPELAVGDEIVIRVLAADTADEPRRKARLDADAEEAQERLNYERLRRKYEQ